MKVLISDNSKIVREGLISLFSKLNGIKNIYEATGFREAVDTVTDLQPDVVIMDFHLLSGNVIENLAHIKKSSPNAVIIILTIFPFPQYRKICMENGADFFFDKVKEINRVTEILKNLFKKVNLTTHNKKGER